MSSTLERRLLLSGFLILYLVFFLRSFLWIDHHIDEGHRRASTPKMMEMTAHKPFVYRTLVPSISRKIKAWLPQDACKSIIPAYMEMRDQYSARLFRAPPRPHPQAACERAIITPVMAALLAGYVLLIYLIAATLFGRRTPEALVAPLIGMLLIPVTASPVMMIYDTASLCLFAWMFYLLLKERPLLYLVIFTIAVTHKETTILAILLFAFLMFDRLPRKRFLAYITAQLCVFIIIKLMLLYIFKDNPGRVVEYHLPDHLRTLVWHFDSPPQLFAFLAGLFLLLYRWPEKPAPLKRGLWIVVAMVPLWLLYGYPREYRFFFEIYCIIAPLITHTLVTATGVNQARLFQSLRLGRANHGK